VAKKKLEGLKNLSVKEMAQKIAENRKALFEAKIKLATGQLENTALIWKTRKEIARIKTFLAQKTAK
jgi:large subunit ribosomal protein L29